MYKRSAAPPTRVHAYHVSTPAFVHADFPRITRQIPHEFSLATIDRGLGLETFRSDEFRWRFVTLGGSSGGILGHREHLVEERI